ncbi:conserved Plasmodium protein, unknown function [Plasmodium ovale wallikeri]|uniref:Liprin-beta-1/2 coiled-coil domain-containing protein n=1 Tax=Plasmodium ovale wallikeri TaxID=864142 RepID=A0A1A8YIU0_PLAOA|nr:conserved Plasmodium protein, unknown function [Plasmodium ovale wallikeri]
MGKSKKLSTLVKNVQFFVKKCREKNKKLLSINSLDDDDDDKYASGNFADDKTNFDEICKEHSIEYSSKGSLEAKRDIYKKYASTFSGELRRIHTQDNFHNLSDYLDKKDNKKFGKLKNEKNEEEKENADNSFVQMNYKVLDNERSKVGRDEILKEKGKDRKMEDVKNEIMEYDVHLSKLYKKLGKGSKNSKLLGKSKKSKPKVKGKGKIKKVTSAAGTVEAAKTIRAYNSEILNEKSELFLRKKSRRKSQKKNGKKCVEEEGELKYNFSMDNSKLDSKSSLLTRGEIFSTYHRMASSKKATDEVYFFQEGISNRLKKKSNISSYDIGCMYMNNAASTKSSKDLSKKKSNDTTLFNSSKSLRRFKFLNDNKKNIEYYKKMIENLEGTVGKCKKKNNSSSSIDNIIKIINCLLHDYVPKLIDRYEYYMNTLDDRNKLLKQKIKESLDFGDIQYEEIREMKTQLMQKNNENKKLNDTIEMLKDKLSYINELELKNAEYLDEIVLMRNRTTYLEKIIEENDQSKESHELRKIRRNLKMVYNKMKNEMRHMNKLKSRYFKRYKKRKFSINKWLRLKEKMRERGTFSRHEWVEHGFAEVRLREGDETDTVMGEMFQSEKDAQKEVEKGMEMGEEKEADKGINREEKKGEEKVGELSKNEKTLMGRADKEVDTSDIYIMEENTGKIKKGKVLTKNKKINTILSNYTFLQLLKREDKRDNGQTNNHTLIPRESYPYYHYFYSNVLANHRDNCSGGRADRIGCGHVIPFRYDGRREFAGAGHVVLSDENYLSLCRKLKECFYEQYFYQCAGGIMHKESGCRMDDLTSVDGKEIGKNENPFVKSEPCTFSPDQARKNEKYEFVSANNSPLGADKNRRKNKMYKLPFDCCYKVNRMISGNFSCSLWGSGNCGSKDNTFCEKCVWRKKSLISTNSSSINKKLKMEKMTRRGDLIPNRGGIKRSHRYYYRVGSMQERNGENGHFRNGNIGQHSNANARGCRGNGEGGKLLNGVGSRGDDVCFSCENEKKRESHCYNEMSLQGINSSSRSINSNTTADGKTEKRDGKRTKGICEEKIITEGKNNVGHELTMTKKKENSEGDNIFGSMCERVNNFKKFLRNYNSHFAGSKSNNTCAHFGNADSQQVVLGGVCTKNTRVLLRRKTGDGYDCGDGGSGSGGGDMSGRVSNPPNMGGVLMARGEGRIKNLGNHVYQINNYYNYCDVKAQYNMYNVSERSNVQNNFVIRANDAGTTSKTSGYGGGGNARIMPALKEIRADRVMQKKEDFEYDAFQGGGKTNIGIHQSATQIHRLNKSYIQHDGVLMGTCKGCAKNETLCTCDKTLRYQNPFNQYIDINMKNYDAINRYLNGHFVYTLDI